MHLADILLISLLDQSVEVPWSLRRPQRKNQTVKNKHSNSSSHGSNRNDNHKDHEKKNVP